MSPTFSLVLRLSLFLSLWSDILEVKVSLFVYSYRDNPTLGDPNSLIEELLEMRNRIRVKEAELVMVRAKVSNHY